MPIESWFAFVVASIVMATLNATFYALFAARARLAVDAKP